MVSNNLIKKEGILDWYFLMVGIVCAISFLDCSFKIDFEQSIETYLPSNSLLISSNNAVFSCISVDLLDNDIDDVDEGSEVIADAVLKLT